MAEIAPLTGRPFFELDGQQINPDLLPGWLLKALDSTDPSEVAGVESLCSQRLYVRLLAQRRDQLEEREAALAAYRAARAAYTLAAAREDAAFVRWFEKAQAGEPTNAGAASRLANQTSYRSADLANAQTVLYALDIDPWDIDDADGVERTFLGA